LAKLALIPVLLALGCLFAGLYGALHNQISYTVSPEYFTRFKFPQMSIPESLPERVGAAIVGVLASWWMGLVIGVFVIPVALRMPDARTFFAATLRAYAVVAMTTLVVGLLALAAAFLLIDEETVDHFMRFANEIEDNVAFARAGTIHNFSYLGGLIGIVTGCVSIVVRRRHDIGRL